MNLNDIRKNAYLNINNAENQPDENDIVFEEKKDQIILSKNVQNNTVKKFTFQSISKVVDEIQNQKNQNSIQSSNQNQFGGQNQLNQNEKNNISVTYNFIYYDFVSYCFCRDGIYE